MRLAVTAAENKRQRNSLFSAKFSNVQSAFSGFRYTIASDQRDRLRQASQRRSWFVRIATRRDGLKKSAHGVRDSAPCQSWSITDALMGALQQPTNGLIMIRVRKSE